MNIKSLIKITYGMQGVLVEDDGTMINMYSRQNVGTINFEKCSYNEETKNLSICMTPRKPLEFIMIDIQV